MTDLIGRTTQRLSRYPMTNRTRGARLIRLEGQDSPSPARTYKAIPILRPAVPLQKPRRRGDIVSGLVLSIWPTEVFEY